MTKVTMPKPLGYVSARLLREFAESSSEPDVDLHIEQLPFANRSPSGMNAVALITTTQAEAYADARVAESQQWLPIETAPKDGRLYEISVDGKFRVDGVIRTPYVTGKGYLRVTIGKKSVSVHRLVAQHFVPNPRRHIEVNHLDGDKRNNSAANLEWCSRSENMKHAYAIGLHPGVRLSGKDSPNWKRNGKRHPQSMPVRAVFPDGSVRDYDSQGLAEKDGFSPPKISACINGHRKSHGGAKWMPLPAPPIPGPVEP